jgi:hypothetical protein
MKVDLETRERKWQAAGSNGHQCRQCGEVFNSLGAFDAHHTGPMERRMCLNPEEIGMHVNHLGRWAREGRANGVSSYHVLEN